MRIGVTSDLHGMLPEVVEPCELVLLCGDIVPLHMQRNIPQSEKWLKTEFAEWINNLPCKQVFMVGGNHDFALANMYRNQFRKASILTQPTNGKLMMLDNEEVGYWDENATVYTIWGTPYCKIFGNWAYMYEPETLREAYSSMPAKCDIVMSHDAPRLCGLGKIHQRHFQEDVGNHQLADEIMRKHPRFTFCGHIHSGEHVLQTLDDMQMANVSYVDESYSPAFNVLYLDV